LARESVSRPSTAWTSDATEVSSEGACWLTIAVEPFWRVTCASDTENACAAVPAVAVTGIESPLALV